MNPKGLTKLQCIVGDTMIVLSILGIWKIAELLGEIIKHLTN